uniref:SUN domain-containing protein n=1 Tax=Caenorhabditis tropicalis TaxID=1561998 RepID=A0A1I7TK07_9PELO
MKLEHLLLVVVLILLPKTEADQAVSFVKNWKEILLTDGVNNTTCTLFIDGCVRSVPYNVSKKVTKKSVNASEEETIPEKSIESFDEWTKKGEMQWQIKTVKTKK